MRSLEQIKGLGGIYESQEVVQGERGALSRKMEDVLAKT